MSRDSIYIELAHQFDLLNQAADQAEKADVWKKIVELIKPIVTRKGVATE